MVIEILLYSLAFKDDKSADKFCKHWTTDVVHGRFVYQGKEFIVPELPEGHRFIADIAPNHAETSSLGIVLVVDQAPPSQLDGSNLLVFRVNSVNLKYTAVEPGPAGQAAP